MKRLGDLFGIKGRVAIVTGGAGHLGLAIGEALAESGAHVVVADLDAAACDQRAKTLTDHAGVPAFGIAADISSGAGAERLVQATLEKFGRLDIVFNNAALTGASTSDGYSVPFDAQSEQAWDAALGVNLTPVFLLAKAARASLAASGKGAIVNIASIYGVVGPDMRLYDGTAMGNPAAYAATKGGMIQLTRYLSTVLAPSIRVNAISPGGIERGQPEAFRKRYVERTPLGRMATEEDLKGIAAFLASDASAYVTGQNVILDGGWTAW
jgi:NAD(P)-dependent dehydrogenase (short-subunit alcohol dehydrogenase family)